MKLASFVVALSLSISAFSQAPDSLNHQAEPIGGMSALAVVYFKIDFTKKEIEYLRNHEAELIFMVNENGQARLEKVNDIEIVSIIDSMKRADDRIPGFYPEVVDGKAQSSLFFVKLRWPHYESGPEIGQYSFARRNLDKFEFIDYYGARVDILISGVGNVIGGNIKQYNHSGGGMKVDATFFGNHWGGGMVMAIHGGKAKENYPITTVLPQNSSRSILFIGGAVGKLLKESARGSHFIIQFEPCFASQTIVPVDQQVKNKPVQSSGFSPGFTVNYNLSLGAGKMSAYHFAPVVVRHYVNFHIGVRPMIMDKSFTSGTIFEAGIGYRMAMRHVNDYKLKD